MIPLRESEKAVMLKAQVEHVLTGMLKYINVWFPKSVIKNDKIARWFAHKKDEEIADNFNASLGHLDIVYFDKLNKVIDTF